MLQVPAPFPHPGSAARAPDGLVYTIMQRLPGDLAVLTRRGDGASATRREAIADLVDPDLDLLNVEGLDRTGIAQMKWLRETLRTANAVVFSSLHIDMRAAAHQGRVPTADSATLVGLLRRLGWEKTRNTAMPNALSIWSPARTMAVAA